MTKRQFTFWIVMAVLVVLLVLFFKFNPLYATFEVVAAFVLGLFGEWILERIYNKLIK